MGCFFSGFVLCGSFETKTPVDACIHGRMMQRFELYLMRQLPAGPSIKTDARYSTFSSTGRVPSILRIGQATV